MCRCRPDATRPSHSSSTAHGLSPGLSGSLTIYGKNSTNQRATENVDNAHTSLISGNNGNVVLRAGADEQYKGTGQGNVTMQGGNLLAKDRASVSGNAVDMQAVDNALHSTYHADSKSLTLGARPAGVLGTLVNTVTDAINNQSNGSSDRLAAASAMKAGYDVYKFVDSGKAAAAIGAIGKGSDDPTKASIGVSISINASQSSQDSEDHTNTRRGANIQASNIDVTSNEGDISMGGAKLQAENITLDAAQALKLFAAQSDETIKSSNQSSSAGLGVTFGVGAQSGFSFQVSAAQAKGHANGSETNYDNTQILASNKLNIKSGGNTELKGAQLAGKQVKADIGGDLLIESLQDTSQYESKQTSSGFDISICPPVICAGATVTGSVSASKTTIDHSYRSAVGQSGIAAGAKDGNGGYDIKVAGNTDLKGGAITSEAPKEKNNLQTKSLTFSDLENKQDTNVSASAISLSYNGAGALGTIAASAGGTILANNMAKAGLPESGSEKSQTQSVISPANVTITGQDEDGISQQAVASLTSRDAATANGALKNNLSLVQAQDIQKNQKEAQDDIRAAGIIGSMGTEMIGDAAHKNHWSAETKMLAHGALGAGLALIGGGSAATGFITGAANEMAMGAMGDYLEAHGVPRLLPSGERNPAFNELMMAGSAALGTVVGTAAGGNATNVALSGQTAKTATENNFLKHDPRNTRNSQLVGFARDLATCKATTGCNVDTVYARWTEISNQQQQEAMGNMDAMFGGDPKAAAKAGETLGSAVVSMNANPADICAQGDGRCYSFVQQQNRQASAVYRAGVTTAYANDLVDGGGSAARGGAQGRAWAEENRGAESFGRRCGLAECLFFAARR